MTAMVSRFRRLSPNLVGKRIGDDLEANGMRIYKERILDLDTYIELLARGVKEIPMLEVQQKRVKEPNACQQQYNVAWAQKNNLR